MDVRVLQKNVHATDMTYGSDRKNVGKNSDIRPGSDGIPVKSVDIQSVATKGDPDDKTTINMEKVRETVVVGTDANQKNSIEGSNDDKDNVIRCKGDYEQSPRDNSLTDVTGAGKAINKEAIEQDAVKTRDLGKVGETKEPARASNDKVSGRDIAANNGNIKATTNSGNKDNAQGTRVVQIEDYIHKIKEKKAKDDLSGHVVSASSGNLEGTTYKGNKDKVESTQIVQSKKEEENISITKEKDDLIDNNFSRNAVKKSPIKQDEIRGNNAIDIKLSDRILNRGKHNYILLGTDAPRSSATEEIGIKNCDKNTEGTAKQSSLILTELEKKREILNIANTEKSQGDDPKTKIMESNDNKIDIPAGIGNTEKKDYSGSSGKVRDIQNNAIRTSNENEETTCRATINLLECKLRESTTESRTVKTNSFDIIKDKESVAQHLNGLETGDMTDTSDTSRIRKDDKVFCSKEAKADTIGTTVVPNKEEVTKKDDRSGSDLPKTIITEKVLIMSTNKIDAASANVTTDDAAQKTLATSNEKEESPGTNIIENNATKTEEVIEGRKMRAEVTDEYRISPKLTATSYKSELTYDSGTARNTNQKGLTEVTHNDNILKVCEDKCSQAKASKSNTSDKQHLAGSHEARNNAINVDRIEITKKELTRKNFEFLYSARRVSVGRPIGMNNKSKCIKTDVDKLNNADIKETVADGSTSDANSAKVTRTEDSTVDSEAGNHTPDSGSTEKDLATIDDRQTFTESDTSRKQGSVPYELTQKDITYGQTLYINLKTIKLKTDVTNSCIPDTSTVPSEENEVKRDAAQRRVLATDEAIGKDEEVAVVSTDDSKQTDTAEKERTCISWTEKSENQDKEKVETTIKQPNEASDKTTKNELTIIEVKKQNEINTTISKSETESRAIRDIENRSDESENHKDDALESSVIARSRNTNVLPGVQENENAPELGEVNSCTELKGHMSKNLDNDLVDSNDDANNNAKKADLGEIRGNEYTKTGEARRSTRMETLAEDYYTRGFMDYNLKCSGSDIYHINKSSAAYSRRDANEVSEAVDYDPKRCADQESTATAGNAARTSDKAISGDQCNAQSVRNNVFIMGSVYRSKMIPVTRTNDAKVRRGETDVMRMKQPSRAPHTMFHREPSQASVDGRVQCTEARNRSGMMPRADSSTTKPMWIKEKPRHTELTQYQMAGMSRHDKGSTPENVARYESEKDQSQLLETKRRTDNDAGKYADKQAFFSHDEQVPQRLINSPKERRKKSSSATAKHDVTEDDGIRDKKTKERTTKSEGKDKRITRRSGETDSRTSKKELTKKRTEKYRKKSTGGAAEQKRSPLRDNVAKANETKSEVPKNLLQKFVGLLADALDSFIPSDEESESNASVTTEPKPTKDKLQLHEDAPNRIAKNSEHNDKRIKLEKGKTHLNQNESNPKPDTKQNIEQQLADRKPKMKDVQTTSAVSKATKQKNRKTRIEDHTTENDGISNNSAKKMTTKGELRETDTARRSSKVTSERELAKSRVTKEQYTKNASSEVPKKTVFHRLIDAITTGWENTEPSLCAEIFKSLEKAKRSTDNASDGNGVQEENATVYSGNSNEERKTKHPKSRVRAKEEDTAKQTSDMCLITENNTSTTYIIQAEVHATDEQADPETTANAPRGELRILNNIGEDNVTLAEIIADDLCAEASFQTNSDIPRSRVTSTPVLSPVEEIDEIDNETAFYFAFDVNQNSETADKPVSTTDDKTAEDGILQNDPVQNDTISASRDPEADNIITDNDAKYEPSDDSFSWDFSSKGSPSDDNLEQAKC